MAAPRLRQAALACLLVMPVFLMHGRAIADILVCAIDVLFLFASWRSRDWRWIRRPWLAIGAAWWAWLVLCSVPGIGVGGWLSLGHALADARLLLLVAALEHWVLRDPASRRWLARALAAAALYIGLSAWLQFATGRNLLGYGRFVDGELTGPFEHPRAAAPLSRLIFPVTLPLLARLMQGRLAARLAAIALAALSVGTIVLIGQRMPLLLTIFGVLVCALFLRRLRLPMLLALGVGAAVLGASVVVSPPTWYRLVTKFSAQMDDFRHSDYGLIYRRALVITAQHPIFGRGFAGFRNACPDPATFVGWPGDTRQPEGGGAVICNIHPHNHYLEAATDAGLPGLVLFSGMIVAWLAALARRLGPDPDPRRIALFAAALMHEWPIAAASSFRAIEFGGWFFVLLGWGLAEARAAAQPSTSSMLPPASRPTM